MRAIATEELGRTANDRRTASSSPRRVTIGRRRSSLSGVFLVVAVALAAVGASSAVASSSGGTITTIAGTGTPGSSGDGGPAVSAQLRSAYGVAVDKQGNVYISDFEDRRVRVVRPNGTIATFAGRSGGGVTGDGGPATSARIDGPVGLAADAKGNVYIAEYGGYRVRKVSPDGVISTFAGTGQPGFSGDGGPATAARLYAPAGIAVDAKGNVYIVDSYNHRVRKVDTSGTITTIAGTGVQGASGDGGPATSARLQYPVGVAVDGQGSVYVVDSSAFVRKVSPGGTITTFAGGGSTVGNGGLATSAQLRSPNGLAVDGKGNVYISEFATHQVRVVGLDGKITLFAGSGSSLGDGGQATAAQLYGPRALAVDGSGNVYIGDHNHFRVRKVTMGTQAAAVNVTLGGAAAQPLLTQKSIVVTAKSATPCSLSATGAVTILGTKYLFVLTRTTLTLGSGTRTLTLRFSAVEQRRYRKALKSGQKSRATITVKCTTKAGASSASKRIVTISG
jgi:sugar lactone lactonase YvrE